VMAADRRRARGHPVARIILRRGSLRVHRPGNPALGDLPVATRAIGVPGSIRRRLRRRGHRPLQGLAMAPIKRGFMTPAGYRGRGRCGGGWSPKFTSTTCASSGPSSPAVMARWPAGTRVLHLEPRPGPARRSPKRPIARPPPSCAGISSGLESSVCGPSRAIAGAWPWPSARPGNIPRLPST